VDLLLQRGGESLAEKLSAGVEDHGLAVVEKMAWWGVLGGLLQLLGVGKSLLDDHTLQLSLRDNRALRHLVFLLLGELPPFTSFHQQKPYLPESVGALASIKLLPHR
jgi:hypothetical protein